MNIDRKAFVVYLASGASAGWLAACGGGDAPAAAAAGGCSATIAGNHGHVLSIPSADLDAATDKTYDIQGSADHTHTVTFTMAQLAQLKAGQPVTVVTSNAFGHEHSVSETCT